MGKLLLNDARLESELVRQIRPRTKKRGYWAYEDFLLAYKWKTGGRFKPSPSHITPQDIKDKTRIAMNEATTERSRIEVLTQLHGIGYPIASVLLHFGHQGQYPILDFRALWSVGIDKPPSTYSFDLWWNFVRYCRDLAKECGVTMRMLDRALWQYSKRCQPPRGDTVD